MDEWMVLASRIEAWFSLQSRIGRVGRCGWKWAENADTTERALEAEDDGIKQSKR